VSRSRIEAAAGVTTVSQVIQNSPAIPQWTGLDCNGPLWPEIASEAACSGSKRWHPVDGCGPRQTGRICLRSRRPQVRILPGAQAFLQIRVCFRRSQKAVGYLVAIPFSLASSM
jgi:hypothetical protein